MLKSFKLIFIMCVFINNLNAQNFLNNDLNGIVSGSNILPSNWQKVPFTDINCQATHLYSDTPDLTDIFGPIPSNGIVGNPYSGNTFISGLFGGQSASTFWHEGIMQSVSGFTIDSCYSINFHQAVVKQSNNDYLDTSGCWAIYIDNCLIGISFPTVSDANSSSTSFIWEHRSLTFTASATSHTIKFLPADDDSDQLISNPLGGLRMGIDSLYINPTNCISHNTSRDTTLCQGESLIFDATTANATYLWQDNSTNPTFNITQQGTYWAEVTTNCGSTTDTINVNYNPIPTIDLGNDTTLCQNQTLTLDATTTNATYLWQDNSTNPTFNVTQQGTYWTEVTINNCSTTDTILVNYNPLPIVDLGIDTTLCQGESLIFDATTTNATYLWQDNSTNPTFNITQQGTYWAEVTTNCGSTTDTINVNYNSIPTIDLGNDTTLCQNQKLTLDVTTTNATYLWQDNSTNPIFNVTQQGTYWTEVNINNCSATDTILVNYNPLPIVDLGKDTILCQNQTLTLDATTTNATYLWQDNSTNPTFNVTQQGTYWTEVTVNNCSATDTVLIIEEDCEIILEIPNVFTPNNDGINDLFVPIVSKGIVTMKTIIFNRWGNKIFETNKILIGWDGQDVSDGTYFWIIYYTDKNGIGNSLKGYVTILK